ncbi:cupin-like domain-containing protein [Novosphingobium aquimarinum]|uniref:cupin-like domain-containing protein n=1 Tax=Novosphingobium aquimarinum TaxID=2682494 RepID=UPI0018DBD7E9|nr:cupin-like domain-containing protein [Novosphingobium aquimarinum]
MQRALAKQNEVALAKRDWLMRTRRKLARLSRQQSGLAAYQTITRQQFLDHHYAAHRPALIRGEMADWPALELWTPQYLRDKIGSTPIQYQGGRDKGENYERNKDAHARTMPFDAFIDLITHDDAGNDAYITAYNNKLNGAALKPLEEDLGFFDQILTRQVAQPNGMMWIGPAGTFTPLHHDLTNNLLVQVVGRKRLILVSPDEWPNLYNDRHVFSMVKDLTAIEEPFEAARDIGALAFDMEPGDALFIPIGWWHQVRALDFSVSITYTNFLWHNDFHGDYPPG